MPSSTSEQRPLYRACPGCGVRLPALDAHPDGRYNASAECWQLYGVLSAYTLTREYDTFIHQLAVDAYSAQHAGESVRPIGTALALIGLYLTYERGYSGRQVQHLHSLLANRSKIWPRFVPPRHTYALIVLDVMQAQPGEARDDMLRQWGLSVWNVWEQEHARLKALIDHVMGN